MFDPRLCLKIFTAPKSLKSVPLPSPEVKIVVLDSKRVSWRDLFSFDDFIIFKVRGGFEPVHFIVLVIEKRFSAARDGLELVASAFVVISLVVRKLLSW